MCEFPLYTSLPRHARRTTTSRASRSALAQRATIRSTQIRNETLVKGRNFQITNSAQCEYNEGTMEQQQQHHRHQPTTTATMAMTMVVMMMTMMMVSVMTLVMMMMTTRTCLRFPCPLTYHPQRAQKEFLPHLSAMAPVPITVIYTFAQAPP